MGWGTPLTAVANAQLTAAQWNASVRDNLAETAPAKASTSGSYFAGAGANSIVERQLGMDFVAASETTGGTSFTDLTTFGPNVTLATGVAALVFLSAICANNTAGAVAEMGLDVSGATSVGATVASSLRFLAGAANQSVDASYAMAFCTAGGNALTAGSNTFTGKYRVSSGSGTFSQRRLIVMPF